MKLWKSSWMYYVTRNDNFKCHHLYRFTFHLCMFLGNHHFVSRFQPTDAAVMVFVHGGGYVEGNGYQGYYGGLPLSGIGDVILVTINYRLTALGFLTTGMKVTQLN